MPCLRSESAEASPPMPPPAIKTRMAGNYTSAHAIDARLRAIRPYPGADRCPAAHRGCERARLPGAPPRRNVLAHAEPPGVRRLRDVALLVHHPALGVRRGL